MANYQSLDIVRRSASTDDAAAASARQPQVAKLIDVSRCIGCKACQAACMEWNDLRDGGGHLRGHLRQPRRPHAGHLDADAVHRMGEPEDGNLEWLIRKDGCMHCADPGCLKACPAPGAIVQYANGIVDFISENCIGCGYCVKGCPFNIPRISQVDHKAYKCTLCSDRVAVGQEPACAKACPTGAIMFGTKEDMTQWAGERIEDLKSRGFDNAGLYDPPGVGGTHVMYVLHHADKPSIYAGLPDNPQISPLVQAWKGVMKPIALAALALDRGGRLRALDGAGPNEVQPEDEAEGRKAVDDGDDKPDANRETRTARHRRALHAARARQHWITAALPDPARACPAWRCSIRRCSSSPQLFGGGADTRAIHPWFGVVLLVSFALLFVRFVGDNLWTRDDTRWMGAIRSVLANDEEKVPEVGRYNAGQKLVFWGMTC